LDSWIAEKIRKARGVSFFGAAFASDESPPSGSRFAGYRFQITYVYCPFFHDPATWDDSSSAPVTIDQVLCDIAHCPGKDGAAVLAVVQKQLSRIGLVVADIVSGTGDGGGENEGVSGVHSSLERENGGSYVRRRCLAHISWRSADAGLDQILQHHKAMQALCTYLHEGITWRRLQSICCQPINAGGLHICGEASEQFHAVFGRAAGSILENRPESASHFLRWLIPREPVLSRCIAKDVEDRNLSEGPKLAKQALEDPLGRVRRSIHYELLERALFLFRWGKEHVIISSTTTLSDLVAKCMGIVGSLEADDTFLKRFRMSRADLLDKGIHLLCLPTTTHYLGVCCDEQFEVLLFTPCGVATCCFTIINTHPWTGMCGVLVHLRLARTPLGGCAAAHLRF
jgi:hypothetical protein